MFEPRRGAGDGDEGGRGSDSHAEWPSCEASPQVRQLSRKTCDVRFLRLEGDQLGERRSRRPQVVDDPGPRGSRRCSGRPGAVSRGVRSVRTLLSTPGVWRQGGVEREASVRTRPARENSPVHVPVVTGRQENWDRLKAPGRGAREPWRDRRRRMRRGRRPPAPAELSDVAVDPRAVGLQDGFQQFPPPRCHLRAVELGRRSSRAAPTRRPCIPPHRAVPAPAGPPSCRRARGSSSAPGAAACRYCISGGTW